MITDASAGFAKGNDFGVSCRIGLRNIAIPAPADDRAAAHDYSSNWDLAGVEGALRTTQGFLHPDFIGRSLV
jgi:hypothetical protein